MGAVGAPESPAEKLGLVTSCVQECLAANPVVVLGSGASIPLGLPSMSSLADHLLAWSPAPCAPQEEAAAWREFANALQSTGLEQALSQVSLPEPLISEVTHRTWQYIHAADTSAFAKALKDRQALPLTRLFAHLFRSTNYVINVVTTNYDRVAEYAANCARHRCYAGFTDGYLRTWDDSLATLSKQSGNGHAERVRTVCVWKVHGSLDWFADQDGNAVALPTATSVPEGLRPLIVTPGSRKYEAAHDEPFRDAISRADAVLMRGSAFLSVGYGFNDKHIHPKLAKRCATDGCPIVIVAKELTDNAHTFIERLVGSRFMAIEQHGTGSRVYTQDQPTGIEVHGERLWSLEGLLDSAIPR